MTTIDGKLKIAFDIDGIITKTDRVVNWWKVTPKEAVELYRQCEPNERMIDVLNQLSKEHYVNLYTARDEAFREVTEEWMSQNGVRYDNAYFNKNHYDYLIDDRATNNVRTLLRWIENNKKTS